MLTKRQRAMIYSILALFALCGVASLVGPHYPYGPAWPFIIPRYRAAALSNMKALAWSTMIYSADHNEALPLAKNWADEVAKVAKNPRLFRVEETPAGEHSMAFMKLLGGKRVDSSAEKQAMLFETTDPKWNAAHNFTQVWWHKERPTAVAFADTHVKSFRYYDPGVPAEGTGRVP